MDFEFHSLEELWNRVHPALRVKVKDFKRLGLTNFSDRDIWDYLIESKWKNGVNLMLSDIVDDIMKLESSEFKKYMHEIKQETDSFIDEEII